MAHITALRVTGLGALAALAGGGLLAAWPCDRQCSVEKIDDVEYIAEYDPVTGGHFLPFTDGRSIWPTQDGETVDMAIESHGCFHHVKMGAVIHDRHRLLLRMPDSELVGIALNRERRAALDSSIGYLRSDPGGGCTTHETLTITWRIGDKIEATETLPNGACGRGSISGVLGELASDSAPGMHIRGPAQEKD